jgi:Protein of unknown function (DUF2949)
VLPYTTTPPDPDMENNSTSNKRLIHFLKEQLALSPAAIAMAVRLGQQNPGPLPMILWQYGLISLEQLEQILDWEAQ